jgi:NADH dehydrogenase FAD-containing subunit
VSAAAAHFDAQPALSADMLIVATGARAPAWLVEAARRDGVAQAADGGIAVRSDLRSTSHPAVFACGDCAGVVDQAMPKSGVHALRQGPVLARNLLALSQGGDAVAMAARGAALELHRYRAARRALALLNRCDGSAIGDWGPFGFAGAWVWRWKDRIDRRFMARFR